MKNASNYFLAVIGAIVLWTGLGNPLSNSNNSTPGTINVSGEAEIKVVPDEVRLRLGVETWHEQLAVAKGRNDRAVEDVIEIARSFGVQSKHIQTDYMGIEPYYQDSYIRRELQGYYVRKTIVIILKDITRFEDLLTAVTEEGATNVHGIEFRTTDLRKYRDQARDLAVRAAKEKAQAMAAGLGESISKTVHIREDSVGWWSWYNYYGWWGTRYSPMSQNVVQNASSSAPEPEGAFAPGQISVTARVSVTFELNN